MLRRWAPKGLINSFSWNPDAGKVLETSVAVRKACQIEDLNAFYGVPQPQRNVPEDNFFTPQIDTPASDALAVILSDGVQSLSSEQRSAWARFLVAFAVRTPETLRKMGPIETRKGLKMAQDRAGGPPDLEAQVSKIIANNMPALERNMPLRIAMELASDPDKIAVVMAMEWWMRQLDRDDILVGDRPLLSMPRMPFHCGIPLDNRNCMIVLPVAPDVLFFASANHKTKAKNRNMTPSRLAYVINEETIACADTYVYSLNSSAATLVKRKLAQKAQEKQ